jgi:uncharacterized protein (TIGR02147 family)
MKSLFEYYDYREYLKDFMAAKKAINKHYSLRTISDKAGFKARDYILRVMNGSRNLSEKGIRMLSQALHHSEKEATYFENLVLFNQAKEAPLKELYFRKIQENSKQSICKKLLENQYSYLSNWYIVVLRSLLTMIDSCSDFRTIGKMLDPPLTESETRKAVELLIELGMIRKDPKGQYHVETTNISVGNEIQSIALFNLHKIFIDLSRRSLDVHSSEERDISGITMSISTNGYKKIQSELKEFRKKIMDIAANDSDEDRVYHLNLHLFPVTRRRI